MPRESTGFTTKVSDLAFERTLRFKDMPEGSLGIIQPGRGYEGSVVVRRYDTVMNLSSGGSLWRELEHNTLEVKLLPKGTIVTLTAI